MQSMAQYSCINADNTVPNVFSRHNDKNESDYRVSLLFLSVSDATSMYVLFA
jgi:hypothetical protein